jgi:hypothetical protein
MNTLYFGDNLEILRDKKVSRVARRIGTQIF